MSGFLGRRESLGSFANQTACLWHTIGFLSFTLQLEHFLVLAGCVPSLDKEVEGLVGRPLSQEPEFWRAAPDVALDFPTTTPVGEGEAPNPAATGLPRAYGMRL